MDAKERALSPTGSHRSLWKRLGAQVVGSACEAARFAAVPPLPSPRLSFRQIPPTPKARTHNLSNFPALNMPI